MTPTTVIAGMLAALAVGLIAGRYLRNSRSGSAVATTLALAVGFALLETSGLDDLRRIVQPRSALDWLPLIGGLALIAASGPAGKWRVVGGVALALLIPVRLLWGSVHLEAASLNSVTLMSLAVWSVALAVPLVLPDHHSPQQPHHLRGNTILWAVTTATTATLIAMSGSLTYGMAVGISGMAIAGVLWSTTSISNLAAFPILCLIGLSAAYSDLPLGTALLLLLTWTGVLFARRVAQPRAVVAVRAAIGTCVLLAGSLSVVRFKDSPGSAAIRSRSGGSASYTPVDLTLEEIPRSRSSTASAKSESRSESPRESTSHPANDSPAPTDDPFAGLDLE